MTDREQRLLEAEKEIDRSIERIAGQPAHTAAYQQEVFALIERIYNYLNLLSGKYTDRGLEIVETVYGCLKYYDPQKGPFRNYFMAVIRQRVEAVEDSAAIQRRGGLVLSRHDQRQIKAILAISHKMQCPLDSEYLPEVAAELLQETPEEIRRLLRVNAEAMVEPETGQSEGGLASISSDQRTESEVLDVLQTGELFREIDQAFHSCRTAQKTVVSKLLTARILAELPDIVEERTLWQYDFWDAELYQRYRSGGGIPSARQISADLGRNEASTSRTLKEFLKKVDRDSPEH